MMMIYQQRLVKRGDKLLLQRTKMIVTSMNGKELVDRVNSLEKIEIIKKTMMMKMNIVMMMMKMTKGESGCPFQMLHFDYLIRH